MTNFIVFITLSGTPPFMEKFQKLGPFILEALKDGATETPKVAFNSKDLSVTAYLVTSARTANQISTRLYSPPKGVGGTALESKDTVYIVEVGSDFLGPNMFMTWVRNRTS